MATHLQQMTTDFHRFITNKLHVISKLTHSITDWCNSNYILLPFYLPKVVLKTPPDWERSQTWFPFSNTPFESEWDWKFIAQSQNKSLFTPTAADTKLSNIEYKCFPKCQCLACEFCPTTPVESLLIWFVFTWMVHAATELKHQNNLQLSSGVTSLRCHCAGRA